MNTGLIYVIFGKFADIGICIHGLNQKKTLVIPYSMIKAAKDFKPSVVDIEGPFN